jgi:hypothetical protein
MSNALEPNQLEPTPRVGGITVFPGGPRNSQPDAGMGGVLQPLALLERADESS